MCIDRADEGLNLTLHLLAYLRVKSEVTLGEFSWEIPQVDGWTQSLATGEITTYVVSPWSTCIWTRLPQLLMLVQ